MGTVKKRKSSKGTVSYYAEVRRKGSAPIYQSFARLTDARDWMHDVESSIRAGRFW